MKSLKYISATVLYIGFVHSAIAASQSSYLVPFEQAKVKAGSEIYIYYGIGVNYLVCKSGSKGHLFLGSGYVPGSVWGDDRDEIMLEAISSPQSGVVVFRAGKESDAEVSCEYKS